MMDMANFPGEKYVYLTTRGRRSGKLHTIELWFAVVEDKVYLSHEGKYTDWMRNILKDNDIGFRIGDENFRGRARIVRQGEAFETGKRALYHKYYGKATDKVIDDWFSESAVIKISMVEKI